MTSCQNGGEVEQSKLPTLHALGRINQTGSLNFHFLLSLLPHYMSFELLLYGTALVISLFKVLHLSGAPGTLGFILESPELFFFF